ncbi:cysteine peptidase C11 clostripain family [Janthinobacterium sp. HH01]|uniref:clostripain-related cysteine peptidase n=1 Tax=Janthinobacterium sp. HH01 TaxID=1198452 RepID=UPI0002AEDFA3|nr:clostripain-related cysteine peptidase [Janthinobacterium sp. HH01]ELX11784.1 cysteine peptidase C11 clostripain family [Janthinobacterium sp. HH01]
MGSNLVRKWLGVFLGAVFGIAVSTAAAQGVAELEWTVMVYMNAKNNLEPFALSNFHSMAAVGSTPKVSVVAQLGRPSSYRYTNEDGDWSGVYRFLVNKSTKPRIEQAVVDVAKSGDSTDMGSPLALKQFIQWSKKTHPAKRYMLVIWNHGQGWRFQLADNKALKLQSSRGNLTPQQIATIPATTPSVGGYRAVSSDDDTGKILYNREVQDVIAAEFTKSKLDLLGYDACLMAMLETAYGVAPSVNVMVGSQELEPGSGWRYATWLDKLVAKPDMGAEDLSKAVVESYRQQYLDEYLTTLSAVRLSAIAELAKSLSDFSDAVRQAGDAELKALRKARAGVSAYGASVSPPLRTSVDLTALLKAYESNSKNAALKNKSAKVRADLAKAIISNYASSRSQYPKDDTPYGSEGLAIYYPESSAVFQNDYFHQGYLKQNTEKPVDFVQKEKWADLLYKLLEI